MNLFIKELIKMMQCKSNFQLKLYHSLNTVNSKAFAVRKIITRGGGPGVTLGSSMLIPLHLPSFRILSTSAPSVSQPLLRSFQVIYQILKVHHHLFLFSSFEKLLHLEKAKLPSINSRQNLIWLYIT